jgi:hypothetical protein
MAYRTIVCAQRKCQRPFHGTTDQAIEQGWSFNMHPKRPVLCRQCSAAEREVLLDERNEWFDRGQPRGAN